MKCKDCGRELSGPFKHPDLGPLYVHPHNNSVWCDINWEARNSLVTDVQGKTPLYGKVGEFGQIIAAEDLA